MRLMAIFGKGAHGTGVALGNSLHNGAAVMLDQYKNMNNTQTAATIDGIDEFSDIDKQSDTDQIDATVTPVCQTTQQRGQASSGSSRNTNPSSNQSISNRSHGMCSQAKSC